MAKSTNMSFSMIFSLILIMVFIVETRAAPTGKSAIQFIGFELQND